MCPQRIIHFQDDFAFFREWDLIRDLYPKLILATHDDKESVIALLKTIDDKINRGFTSKNLILYTLPTRPHTMSQSLIDAAGVKRKANVQADVPKNPAFLQLESEILGLLTDKAPVDFPQRQQIFAEGVLLACLVHDHTPSPEIAEVWFKLLLDTDPDCRLMAVRAAETVLRAAKLPMPNVTKERKQGTSYPPALRPDNDEFQYKRMSPEELKVYYDKPYSVKPHQGFRAWSKPAKLRLRAGLKTDGMESEDSGLFAVHQYVKKVAEAFFKVREIA